ncbi:phage tail fiber protein [Xenorhabdus sp. KK7.4]|uniref:phage tail fiber protein n=1 Tax=Xenorhabdus sp. KK7.4 TaxID=1851572 RepID=UPI000C04B1FA|nr:tail fiber protein [Xenorhabdus sp. KK7.4]PHM51002.1 tail protein [Xenorhabdus sp. KK7.4]
MQDKKPDVPVSGESNLVIVATPEYVKDSIKEAIAEHAASRNHPYATQAEPGLVTLSNAIDNDSEITVATSKAVKKAYDLANTANQNALNNNSNLYLEKKKNGADIPDKAEFVKNLGLEETVTQAQNSYPKTGGIVNGEVTANRFWTKTAFSLGEGIQGERHGILISSKDSVGFDGNNIELLSWNGIGMRSTLDDKTNIYFDTRAGNIGIQGELYAQGAVHAGSTVLTPWGDVNGSTWGGFLSHWIENNFSRKDSTLRIGENVIIDSSGYYKKSSPIILIYSTGEFTTNNESTGAITERVSEGIYLIKGISGLNTDGILDNIEIPLCQNKLPLIWINHEVLSDGSIKLMTYHREHSDAPAFARNIREGYSDGDLIDIPDGRFVSVRVQMPDTK